MNKKKMSKMDKATTAGTVGGLVVATMGVMTENPELIAVGIDMMVGSGAVKILSERKKEKRIRMKN